MTPEELSRIPFRCVAHMSMEDENCLIYESKDGRLGWFDHTKKKNGDFGRTYRHWRVDGKVYKSKKKFLEALADFSPNVKPMYNYDK